MNLRLLSRSGDQTMANEPSWIEARSGSEADVLELAEDLRKAELRGDVAFLERVLAPDFVGIGPRGFVLTKEAWLGRHRSGDLKYETLDRDEVSLRAYADAAIMTSREIGKTKYKGQEVPIGALRPTHAVVRRRGRRLLAGVPIS